MNDVNTPIPSDDDINEQEILKDLLPDGEMSAETEKVGTIGIEGNPPASPSATPADKTAAEAAAKPKNVLGKGFYLGCLGIVMFFVLSFVVLAVVALKNDPKNSFLASFGIAQENVQGIVSTLINVGFGLVALVLLLLVVVGLFRALLFRAPDKSQRNRSLAMLGVWFVFLIATLFGWVVVYRMIGSITPSAVDATLQGDIVAFNPETNQPLVSTTSLTAPIDLLLSAENVTKRVANLNKGYQILSYEWDLNADGKYDEAQTGEKVRWTFEDKGKNAGKYEVTMRLTVRDAEGVAQTQEFKKDVTISSVRPKVFLKADPVSGKGPLKVTFDASESIDPDGQRVNDVTFGWDFLDKKTFTDSTDAKTEYTFDQVGTYKVQLRVQDREGLFTIAEQEIEVTAIKQDIPQVKVQASPVGGKPPLSVQFSSDGTTTINGKITSYEWDFGDGTPTMRGASAMHTFNKPGTFTVTLKAIDEAQKEGKGTVTITVEGKTSGPRAIIRTTPSLNPLNQFQKVLEGPAPLAVSFDATLSTDPDKDIVDYQWDTDGDGTFETRGAKPEAVTYYEPVDTVVTLKVIDAAGNEGTETVTIRPKTRPIAAIIKATPLSGIAPLLVSFDGSASRYDYGDIVQYEWDFNDGSAPKVTGAQIKYTFTKIGTYKVRLSILTNDGKKESTTQNIIVTETPLVARFEPSIAKGVAPVSVTFDPSSSTGAIASYSWDFGDGVQSSERKPSHTYSTPGIYTIVLTVRDKDGVTSQFTKEVIVE